MLTLKIRPSPKRFKPVACRENGTAALVCDRGFFTATEAIEWAIAHWGFSYNSSHWRCRICPPSYRVGGVEHNLWVPRLW